MDLHTYFDNNTYIISREKIQAWAIGWLPIGNQTNKRTLAKKCNFFSLRPDNTAYKKQIQGQGLKNRHKKQIAGRTVCKQQRMIGKKAEQYFSFILQDKSNKSISFKKEAQSSQDQSRAIKKEQTKTKQANEFQSGSIDLEYAQQDQEDQGSETNDQRFEAQLQNIKRQLDKKYAKYISKSQESQQRFNKHIIQSKKGNEEAFRKSMKVLFSDYDERWTEKQLIAKIVIHRKQFNLKIVREEFAKAKPGFKMQILDYLRCRDRRRTLSQGLSVDFMRSLQRYLIVECGVNIQPLKKSNVMFLTKTLTNCKSVMKEQMKETTLNFLKFVYDLEEVNLNPQALYDLYRSLASLSDQLIIKKYQISIKKNRPHELPLSSLFKVAQSKHQDQDTLNNPVAQLNRSWTQDHEQFLRNLYLQTQSFAIIRERFRQQFPSDYHMWTMHTLELRFQRVIRQALRSLRMIVYHKKNKHLPPLNPIDSKMARVITLRVPFKQIRIQLVSLLANKQDMKNVVELINNLNRQCLAWQEKSEIQTKSNVRGPQSLQNTDSKLQKEASNLLKNQK